MVTHVEDEYRKNELSLISGGVSVKVRYSNGSEVIYDKVKNVKAYCSRVMHDPKSLKIWVNDEEYWERANNK